MTGAGSELGDLLKHHGLTLGAVESATGGLISHLITNIPGCSEYFKGALITYSNDVKIRAAGVREATLKKYGAVSPQVAGEMAAGGKKVLEVDVCVSDTGIAGPAGATPGKPVGLFYIGLAHQGGVFSKKLELHGARSPNKQSAAEAALAWLAEYLKSL
jgi:nicotinamide-nucleotide amidase